jgi:hypothetical protein
MMQWIRVDCTIPLTNGVHSLPSGAPSLLHFRRSIPLAILFCASAIITARADEPSASLYDKSRARALHLNERSQFGPGASGVEYDARMIRAAEIARSRAHPKTTWYCWRYVKDALLASGVIASRPTTPWAKDAGEELCRRFGFRRLDINDPRRAPVGAVIVYGGQDAGHVELRTANGFVSDFVSSTPYPRPLVGVFVKPS